MIFLIQKVRILDLWTMKAIFLYCLPKYCYSLHLHVGKYNKYSQPQQLEIKRVNEKPKQMHESQQYTATYRANSHTPAPLR